MQISVIGAGYVGCVTGIRLAEIGHDVVLMDLDPGNWRQLMQENAQSMNRVILQHLLVKNNRRIRTTRDIRKAISETELTLICVGTPQNEDGSTDLRFVKNAAMSIGKAMKSDNKHRTIIMKSTVLPGTTEHIVVPILEKESGKDSGKDFDIGSNPEFLKRAVQSMIFFIPIA